MKLILLFVLCILLYILFKARYITIANLNTREFLHLIKTNNSIENYTELDCAVNSIHCLQDSDCTRICANKQSNKFVCNAVNTCVESQSNENQPNHDSKTICNTSRGFYPALEVSEKFGERWTCLNTLNHIFDDNQQFHSYICNGATNLNTRNLVSSCTCPETHIRMKDIFRPNLVLCLEKKYISLFPNFQSQ